MDSPPESDAPSGARIIKRYANRKLYDTRDSRYVTLREIEALVREGEDLRIIDNSTKEDLTSVTLAQVVLEQERKGGGRVPAALRDFIHTGGERLIASTAPAAKRVAEVLEHGRGALDELQKRIDERVRTVLVTLAPWAQLQSEVKRLAQRVEELERKLRERE